MSENVTRIKSDISYIMKLILRRFKEIQANFDFSCQN